MTPRRRRAPRLVATGAPALAGAGLLLLAAAGVTRRRG